MVRDKKFKVYSVVNDSAITWDVMRIDHAIKGNYILATFYDRGSVQLFIKALTEKGFIEVNSEQ